MNKFYCQCSECGRVIYASQAAENGGTCGSDCPQGRTVDEALPKVPRRQPVAVPAPVEPRIEILPPLEPAPPPETDGEASLAGDEPEAVPEVESTPEDAPAPRNAAPGANRMHQRGGGR